MFVIRRWPKLNQLEHNNLADDEDQLEAQEEAIISTADESISSHNYKFAGVFELPTEGLSDFSDVPKNLVYDARKIFSKSGEPVVPHGKKKLLKYEYRLLNDILAKSITVKAGSVDAVTNDRFQMMMAIHFGLKVNWSKVLFGVLEEMVDRTVKKAKGYRAKISILLNRDPALTMGEATPFPSSKILSPKTVLTYITTNYTADARGQSDEGGKTPVAIVKRASKLKKKSESTSDATVEIVSEVVGSKKRPAVEGSEPVVPKKRRTTKSKSSVSSANMDMASVAQGAIPLQVIAPTPAVTTAQPPAPKRKSRKRRWLPTTDEVDVIIVQILTETSKLTTDDTESGEQIFTETDVGDIVFGDSTADNPEELAQWLENYISEGAEQVNESDSDRVQVTVDTVDGEQLFETANVEEAEGSISPVVEKDLAKVVCSKHNAEELMCIDDLLLQIPDDMLLPSVTSVEITKIRLDESISINEEDEPVKGNPARETVELICGDVEFLVQLRDRVMIDVVEFFHSFSHNKLSNLDALLELKAKEKLMLDWAETDSLETAVKRKVYILAKYREMLLRKFVESHRKYYTPGQSWTATTSKIIDLLSVAHSKSLEDLIAQQKEHGLPVEQPCTSTFLDASVGSGAVLAQFYSMAKSTCWKLPETVIEDNFVPHVFFIEPVQYWGAAPSLIKTWGWARVCTDIIRYSMFGCLRPVREDVCTYIVVYNLGVERIPASFRGIFQQCIYTDSFVGYFNDLDVQNLSDFEESSSDGSTVYRSPSPLRDEPLALGSGIPTVAQEEQLYFVQSPESPPATSPCLETSTSSISLSMHFDGDDIPLDDTADIHTSLPVGRTEFVEAIDDLRTLLFSGVAAHGLNVIENFVDVKKELSAQDAKITALDGQIAAIRSEQLEFQAKITADLLSLSTQLGDIVDYIRGGDAKKGEGSSSHRPLPSPVNQGESSGNVVRTTMISQRVIDNAQRYIVERMMTADRERERSRGSRSGSYKRRRF
ncbi:hypothetical protein F511_11876 [Dorcoceras hygrometricum]|uniref:Uncharacterized protein n=1 Tax=Dorcoceras hygrometricum TaxID=472368 RepID=A0A2Z7DKQ7_9LAMI|nr:hypothetical protein F511_11876 [Dorcoceras hygrometricum]